MNARQRKKMLRRDNFPTLKHVKGTMNLRLQIIRADQCPDRRANHTWYWEMRERPGMVSLKDVMRRFKQVRQEVHASYINMN